MIRPAKFIDTPRLVELLCEMQRRSKYAGHVGVDEKAAHTLIAQAIQRHGGSHYGASLVMVAEQDEQVEGFIIGMLDRVYHIGDRLSAQDLFLYCTELAQPRDFLRLFNAYLNWASVIPKVWEIKASWTDTLPDAAEIGRLYERLGFQQCGAIYERTALPHVVKEKA